MSQKETEIYEFGPFRLDVAERSFSRKDGIQNGHLPEKAFQTLALLIRNRGHLLTKQDLLTQVWPDAFVEENNLDKCIHTIRHVLGEKPSGPKYIETVRKHGYRFVAPVRRTGNDSSSLVESSDAGRDSYRLAVQGFGRKFNNAFEAYQQARILNYNVMAAATSEALALAMESIRLDSAFAPAYSLMAEIILVEVIVGAKQPKDGFPEARAAIAKAYELGADSADFYAASAYVSLIADWNFDAAERDLRKALAINPHHGTANRMLAETCMFQCRHDEAAVYVNRAQVDELTATRNADILAISLYFARDYQAAIDVCDRLLGLYPRFIVAAWTRCWPLEQMGRTDEAIAGYEKILRLPYGEPALRWIGYAYAVAGDREKALEIATRLDSGRLEHSISPCHLAAIYSALNEPDTAFSYLEQSLEMRDPWMLWTAADPRFDNLRSDPRFDGLLRRNGLI
jgi:DNA-binding winged helix-turn-helix (wHTH) protein/Flp pilus assembly protein TadD